MIGEEACWRHVVARDPAADGRFVYAVRTTGVFCRPSCPSRRARRENVTFYETIAEAEAAGYRPCKRCTPRSRSLHDRQLDLVERACKIIDEEDGPVTLDDIARRLGVSSYHFHRTFKAITGVTPRGYAAGRRQEKLRRLLPRRDRVVDAIYEAGYGSGSRVYQNTAQTLGMTPRTFQKGAPGLALRYATTDTPLGCLVVAASERGLCVIEFGEGHDALAERVRERFPKARLSRDDAGLRATLEALVGYIERPVRGLSLPLDIQGTAFQRRVWEALRAIPVGTTASYRDVAAASRPPRAPLPGPARRTGSRWRFLATAWFTAMVG